MRHILRNTTFACVLVLLCVAAAAAAKIQHRESVYNASAEAPLLHPEGVACGQSAFVIADTGNSQLVRYSISNQNVTPDAVFPLPEASPIVVQIAADGAILVLDGKTRAILKMSPQGQVTGKVEPKNLSGADNLMPRSFKLDQQENIYILDVFGERVLILDASEAFQSQIAFPETYGFFSDLAIGPGGSVYLLDSVAGEIYTAQPGAETFQVFSRGLQGNVDFPISLALDDTGAVYVSDQNGSGLAQIGRDGSFQGRKFGMGWEDGQLYYPAQVCINARGNLIIADRNNSRVQIFNILNE